MSFPKYPEYKSCIIQWTGDIPAHWETLALKRVALLKSGNTIGPDQITDEGEYPVYGGNGQRGYTDAYTHEGFFPLVGRQGALCGNVNYASGRFWASEHAVVTTALRPLEPKWLGELLRTMNLGQYSVSAAQPGLSVEIIANLQIPLPPLPEQSAIAAFLERETAKIDTLVAEQEKLIELLKEKRQAVISHAVTKGLDPNVPMKDSGVEWLGEVPEHWDVISLKRLWNVIDCKHVTAEFVDEGIPLASIREVQSNFVNLDNAKQTTQLFYELMIEGGRDPRTGDLIFSRNATVGEVAQVADWHPAFAMGQDVCLLRKQDASISTDFLQFVLKSKIVQDQLELLMIGSTFKRINVEEIRNLIVAMPPANEQADISYWLQDKAAGMDSLIYESQHTIDLLKERRSALISAAVTGKIDVRGLAEATQ